MKHSGEVESLWREVVAGRCLEAAVGPGTAGRSRHRRGFSFSLVVRQERASTAHACKGSSRGDFRRGCKSVGSMRSRPRFDHAERAAGARDHILWAVSTVPAAVSACRRRAYAWRRRSSLRVARPRPPPPRGPPSPGAEPRGVPARGPPGWRPANSRAAGGR